METVWIGNGWLDIKDAKLVQENSKYMSNTTSHIQQVLVSAYNVLWQF